MQDLNEFGAFVKNLSNHQNDTKCLAIHSKISEIINATISKSNFMEQWQCEQAMIENGKTNYILLGKFLWKANETSVLCSLNVLIPFEI